MRDRRGTYSRITGPPRFLGVLATLCFLSVSAPGAIPAFGQDFEDLTPWNMEFSPWGSQPDYYLHPFLEYHVTHHDSKGVDSQSADLGFSSQRIEVFVPLKLGDDTALFLTPEFGVLDFFTDAVFPDTHDAFPDYLWNPELGATFRRELSGKLTGGGELRIGSPSDRPFERLANVALQARGVLKVADEGDNAWLFSLDYQNNRGYLNHMPLPGVAYRFKLDTYHSGHVVQGLVGFPSSWLLYYWNLCRIEGSYTFPNQVRGEIGFPILPFSELFAGFDWTNDRYFRNDRPDDHDRLVYCEKRVYGGFRFPLLDPFRCYVEFRGGYAFDRYFFEGRDWTETNHNRLGLGSGPFVSVDLMMVFP